MRFTVNSTKSTTKPTHAQIARHPHAQEANLMLVVCIGRILLRHHHAKMIVHATRVDGGVSLGNQLGAPHVAVPERGVVDGDLRALRGTFVGGILEGRVEIDVCGDIFRAVDVVLIRADLVLPRPWNDAVRS